MEKRRPTYDIETIKAAIGTEESLAMSGTARRDAGRLVFDRAGVATVIRSMSTFENHRIWQNVYHVPHETFVPYVKFQADLITDFFVVSFKEK